MSQSFKKIILATTFVFFLNTAVNMIKHMISYVGMKSYTTGSMPLLVDVSSPRVSPSQHFGVDMNINYVVIFINFLFSKV